MQQKLTLTSQAQSLQKQGFLLTNSARYVTIHLAHMKTGKPRREYLPKDYWEDEWLRSGCETAWAIEGYQLTQAVCH